MQEGAAPQGGADRGESDNYNVRSAEDHGYTLDLGIKVTWARGRVKGMGAGAERKWCGWP